MDFTTGSVFGEQVKSMHKILVVNFPPFHLDDMIDDYLRVFAKDKKIGNNIVCILSSRKGAMKKVQIPFDDKLRA